MLQRYAQLFLGIIIGLVLGWSAGFLGSSQANDATAQTELHQERNQQSRVQDANEDIPQKAIDVWNYVQENDKPMDGYVGGRRFQNREKLLPLDLKYKEWDVNPKVRGQNRGAERLVSSSNGRAWYTSDHYRSFTELKK